MSIFDDPDVLSVALRAVSFTLLLNAAGIPIFIAAFGRLMPSAVPAVKQLGWKLAVGALVFVVGHHALEAARMAGEMSGVMDPAMQKMALLSPAGAAFAARVLGLVLVAVGLRRAAPLPVIALVGALISTTAFTLVGHTSVTPHRLAAAALVTLHLLVVAFWLGALWPLYLAAKKEQPAVTARVIDAFSLAAAWVVPLILLAGIGLTALLVPSLAVFRQPYGQLLLAKVSLFALLMAMAALNKWRFGPACAEGNTAAFERTVVIEYVLIAVVLAVTAVLTTFYSPEGA
jgi:putative copper export protein